MTKADVLRGQHAKTGLKGIDLRKHLAKIDKRFKLTDALPSFYPSSFMPKAKKPKAVNVKVDVIPAIIGDTPWKAVDAELPTNGHTNGITPFMAELTTLIHTIGAARVKELIDEVEA